MPLLGADAPADPDATLPAPLAAFAPALPGVVAVVPPADPETAPPLGLPPAEEAPPLLLPVAPPTPEQLGIDVCTLTAWLAPAATESAICVTAPPIAVTIDVEAPSTSTE